MGRYKENEEYCETKDHEEPMKIVKACMPCLWSFMVSLSGGLILGYWEYEYHLTNSQLWMVPLGLILLVTPMIISAALLVSEICNSEDGNSKRSQPVSSLDDLEKYLK